MSYEQIIHAWKNLEYRLSLSDAEGTLLPDHPAGLTELTAQDMEPVLGGGVYYSDCYCTDGNATCQWYCIA